jgi:exodeoxyribonuclease VII large subunit
MEALAAQLDNLSPLACLARGFAIALSPTGEVVTRADRVAVGDRLTVRLHEGSLGCRVEDVDPEGPPATPGRGASDAHHA